MMFRNTWRFLVFVCLLSNPAASWAWQNDPIQVELKFEARALRVSAKFPAIDENGLEFQSSPWAGVNNFSDNIYLVEATDPDGEPLPVEYRADGIWRVETGKKPFTLSYLVVHQKPTFMNGRSGHFHPTLFANWAFLFGSSYVLEPTDPRLKEHPIVVSIDPGPLNHAWSSWNSNEPLKGFDWFGDSLLIAGDYRIIEIELEQTKVQIAVQGQWKFSDEKIAETIEKIVRAQARYMQTPPKSDLLIAMVPGLPNSRGGTVVGGAIGLYPSNDEDLTEDGSHSLHLIAHEHFHLWNSQILKPKRNEQGNHYKWFHEGCTDYYAYLTLFRESLLSESKLIEKFNELIVDLAQNPYTATATAASIAEDFWKSNDHSRLPYIKGGLTSLLIDLKIRKSTQGQKNIDDFMRGLIAATRASGTNYDRQMIVDVLEQVDPAAGDGQWDQFIDRFTVGTDPLPIEDVLRENEIETEIKTVPLYDLGFQVDQEKVAPGSKITEVESDSAADKAGLQVGDLVGGFSIYHGNTEKPCVISVKRNGKEQDIKFLPIRLHPVIQIVNSKSNQERVRALLK